MQKRTFILFRIWEIYTIAQFKDSWCSVIGVGMYIIIAHLTLLQIFQDVIHVSPGIGKTTLSIFKDYISRAN